MRLDFGEMDLKQRPRDAEDLLEGQGQGVGYEEACGRVEFMGAVGFCSKSDFSVFFSLVEGTPRASQDALLLPSISLILVPTGHLFRMRSL